MMIQYCEKCGSRIEKADLEAGRAVQHRDSMFCPTCAVALGLEAGPIGGGDGAAPRKSSADSTVNRKASGRDPGSSRKPTDSTVRRLGRIGDVEQRAEPPRSEGTSRRERRSDTASRSKSAGPAATPLVIGIGAGIAVLAIVAVVLATGSSSPPIASRDEARATPPPADKPRPPVPPPPDPLAAELAAFRTEALRETQRFGHLLERAAELRERVARTPHEQALVALERDIEQRRNRAAADLYERISTAAKKLETDGSFAQAIDQWRAFDAELLTDTWRSRIDERIGELERVQREKEMATTPAVPTGVKDPEPEPEPEPVVPQPPRSFKVGTIPTGGRAAVLLGGGTSTMWRVQSGIKDSLRLAADGLAIDHKGAEAGLLYVFDRRKYTWRDTYTLCEYQLLAGELTLQLRVPATQDQDKKAPVTISAKTAEDESARALWHRLHVVTRGQACEFWVEGESDAQTIEGVACAHGVIGFGIKPGDRCRVRRLEVHALTDGEVAPANVTGVDGSDK